MSAETVGKMLLFRRFQRVAEATPQKQGELSPGGVESLSRQ